MESILRGIALYFFLLLVFRAAGKRSLSEITTFDFVLLLIIAETTQQALLGEDFSMINAFLLIATLIVVDVGLSRWKRRHPLVDKIIDGVPLILIDDGRVLEERLRESRVNLDDILISARQSHGLVSVRQIRYAILERSGGISIIPKQK